jgi:hypothetical protein
MIPTRFGLRGHHAFNSLFCCHHCAVAGGKACAGGGNYAPNYEAISNALVELLNSPDRMALLVECIWQVLKAHYIANNSSIYWVGTGHMTPFFAAPGGCTV